MAETIRPKVGPTDGLVEVDGKRVNHIMLSGFSSGLVQISLSKSENPTTSKHLSVAYNGVKGVKVGRWTKDREGTETKSIGVTTLTGTIAITLFRADTDPKAEPKEIDGFKAGSGCFKCRDCGKMTRDVGGSTGSVQLCPKCYERAGMENEHLDGGHEGEDRVAGCPLCHEAARKAKAP